MNIKNQLFLIVVFLIISASLRAQIYAESDPVSWGIIGIKSPESIPYVDFPALDMDYVRELEEKEAAAGLAPRIGIQRDVDITMETHGVLDKLSRGEYIWRLGIHCNQASAVALNFSEFHLPEGATLHLYNKDRSRKLGAYTAQNNKRSGRFSIQPFFGEEVTLELQFRIEHKLNISFRIDGIVQCYMWGELTSVLRRSMPGYDKSGPCHNDLLCNQSFINEGLGIAMILVDNNRICTGSLINNTKNDNELYFLTANHCLCVRKNIDKDCIESYDAISNYDANWTFYWNYLESECNSANLNEPAIYETTHGAEILANDDLITSSDFALLRLQERPSNIPGYGLPEIYNGFDTRVITDIPISTAIYGIHHPYGDVKKISFSTKNNLSLEFGRFWRVNRWLALPGFSNIGVTEEGSSGSPLFFERNIVGQLYGAIQFHNKNCLDPDDNVGDYGALGFSWANNGATFYRRRLKDWLDPVGLNLDVLDKKSSLNNSTWFPKVMVNNNIDLYGGEPFSPKDEVHVPFRILGGDFYFYRKNEIKIVDAKINGISVPIVKDRISPIGGSKNEYEITLDLSGASFGSVGNSTTLLEFDIIEAGSSSGFTQHVEADIYFQEATQNALDVEDGEEATDYILGAVEAGIFRGFSDGFRPDEKLTKGQAAKIVCQLGLVHDPRFKLNFDASLDKPNLIEYKDEWYPYVQTLINNGSILSISTFDPNEFITYGELCSWITNTHFQSLQNSNLLANFQSYSRIIKNATPDEKNAIEVIGSTVNAISRLYGSVEAESVEVLMNHERFDKIENIYKVYADENIVRGRLFIKLCLLT